MTSSMTSPLRLANTPDPKYATQRNPNNRTYGPAVGKIAKLLGTPLMEWQQAVADVASEIDENGEFVYDVVIVTVPRQSGKTTLMLALLIHRALLKPRARVWHTAQTGLEASDKFMELADLVETTALSSKVKIKRQNGSQRMLFDNGSTLRPHPPTGTALHGQQSDCNLIDEAWSFDETKGMAVIQAITPTQATRAGAQTIITSTMGNADSIWFHDYVEQGRAGSPGVAYFEWGIPDDADPTDLPLVASYHPAVGHTISVRALEKASRQMLPGEFARAYGNRRTSSREQLIPLDAFQRVQTEMVIPDDSVVCFGAAVSLDRTNACIYATAMIDGTPITELVEFREGTDWVGPRLTELYASHRCAIAVDRFGPSNTVADYLDLEKVPVLALSTKDVTSAAAEVYDRIVNGQILVRPNHSLTEAVRHAGKRMVGDAWTWSRLSSNSEVSIAPLEAMTLSVRAMLHKKPAKPAPKTRFANDASNPR